jgi:hypothetical protein
VRGRSKVLLAAAAVALASAALLWRASALAGAGVAPVVPANEFLARAQPAAAQAALGRRVLVVAADPGARRTGEILESGLAPEGWRLYPATDDAAFAQALADLAGSAAASFDPRRGLAPEAERALALFAVKALLVDDAGKRTTESLRPLAQAEPVLRLEGVAPAAADPVALAAGLRTTPARESVGWTWSDWEDALWGGAVTVETAAPARFVFPYPAGAGRVTVDGAPAARAAAGPLLALDLPAGRSRVTVEGIPPGAGSALAVAGAAGLLLALGTALVALRPSRAEIEAAAAEGDAPPVSLDL